MKKLILALFFVLTCSVSAFAQGTSINTTGNAANASAILDVSSTTQGMLIPRMTLAQRNAISSPADGLMIYQTDGSRGLYAYDATTTSWVSQNGSTSTMSIINSSAGAGTYNVSSDKNARTFVFDCNGTGVATFDFIIQLPPANSYSPGTVIDLTIVATNGNPTLFLKAGTGDTYNAINFNDVVMNTANGGLGVNPANATIFSLITDGVSRWFRAP